MANLRKQLQKENQPLSKSLEEIKMEDELGEIKDLIILSLEDIMNNHEKTQEDPIFDEDDPEQGFEEIDEEFQELDFHDKEQTYEPDVWENDLDGSID